MGSGEARGRGGGRASAADPGELFGEEGGVLGDEIAELDQSFHGEREREGREEVRDVGKSAFFSIAFWGVSIFLALALALAFCSSFGWEGIWNWRGGSWGLVTNFSAFFFVLSLIIRRVFVACVSDV